MAKCNLCFRQCNITEGSFGFCGVRTCKDGKVIPANYGKLTSIALDPIEKKPLNRFHPGSRILSVGSYGCNLRCPFCQNYHISWGNEVESFKREAAYVSPEELARIAEEQTANGNIGIAFTYNEPLIYYEYVLDTARLLKEKGLKTVLVSNGMAEVDTVKELFKYVDAMNIDLKGFTDPGENDSDEEMDELSAWIASLNKDIPLHISRFFPRFHMLDKEATPVETIYHLKTIAEKHLTYVYTGNC